MMFLNVDRTQNVKQNEYSKRRVAKPVAPLFLELLCPI